MPPGLYSRTDPGLPQVYIGEKFLPLFEPYRHKAFYGGRGSAKSHTFSTALSVITSKVHKRVVCARQFQNSIRDSVKELLESKMRALRMIGRGMYRIYDREIVNEATDSRYTFIGLDRNPDSAKSLEGADILWVEEARTINQRSMEIIIPTIREPGSEIWWSWNPEFALDPVDAYFRSEKSLALAEKFKDVPGARRLVVRVGIEDNPFFYHTPLAQEMEFMKEGNFERYKHIWLGEYDDASETAVFPNYAIGRLPVPDYCAPRYGMDFGFGDDPFFVVKVYIIEALNVVYIAREASGHVPLRELPKHIDTVIEDRSDYIKGDSSQPGTIEHLVSQGYNMEGAHKGPGSVKAGITWLQGYQIVIDPECEEMIAEARLYTWQVDKITKKRLNVPVDKYNHGWDATRYACEDHILTAARDGREDDRMMLIPGF